MTQHRAAPTRHSAPAPWTRPLPMNVLATGLPSGRVLVGASSATTVPRGRARALAPFQVGPHVVGLGLMIAVAVHGDKAEAEVVRVRQRQRRPPPPPPRGGQH